MKTRSKNKASWKPTRRNAVLLLAVLLVISAVTLSTLAFMQSMLLGHEESRLTGENIQARYAAESGIDAARLFVASSRAARREAGGTFDNPNRFQAIPVLQTVDPLNPCNYTLIAPNLNESGKYSGVRFGLQNESARLNLNALPIIDSALSIPPELANLASSNLMPTPSGSNSGASGGSGNSMLDGLASANKSGSLGRDLLMALPAMDEEIADAILDFIDADDEVREYGCERDYYAQLPNPYAPINGPLDSIEQLLLVRGVTPYLLFGLDQNRNGVLESSEENAALGLGGAGANPALGGMGGTPMSTSTASGTGSDKPPNLGWAMYLTLYSKERNVTADGSPRVNLNNTDLQLLRTDLGAALGDDIATFIIAYRVYGGSASGMGGLGGMGAANLGAGGVPAGGGGGQGGGRGNRGNGGGQGGPGGGGPGGGGPGGGGPGGGGPGGGPGGGGPGGGGRGGPGGGGGAPRGGGRSDFVFLGAVNPMLSLVSFVQPPSGGGRSGAGQGGGGQGGRGQGGSGQGGGFGGRGGGQGGGGMGGGFGGRGGRGDGGRGGRGNGPGGNGPGGGGFGGVGQGGGGQGGGGQGGGGQGGGGGQQNIQMWSAAQFEALNIDLTQGAGTQVNGVLELIDAQFTATVNGEETTFLSPLSSSPIQMSLYLPMLMDKVTTVEAPVLPGRININEAPREILAGLPGLDSDTLDKLIESRSQSSDTENRKFETWPMVEGILTLQQMRTIAPLLTGGGDVMRVQSIGYFEQSAGYARIEAVIDGAMPVPTVVMYRKLDHLGRGFSQSTLGQRAMGLVTPTSTSTQ